MLKQELKKSKKIQKKSSYIRIVLKKWHFQGPELIVFGLFLILLLPKVFQQGLFFDGLIYSSLANNLATGKASLWELAYSETIWPQFYDHPPFAIWTQAIFIKVFKGAYFAEKIYSFLMAVLSLWLILKIWKVIFKEPKMGQLFWLPLFLWILTPKVFWIFNNNMLEATLTVITLASSYFAIRAIQTDKNKYFFILISGFFLFLAFLTKGPVGLFPLAIFMLFWISNPNKIKLANALIYTIISLGAIGLLLGLLFTLVPESLEYLKNYLNIQVFGSIEGKQRVGSRLNFLRDIFMELLPMLIVSILFIAIRWKSFKSNWKTHANSALFFFLIGFSAIAPLFVSPKLSAFYIVPGIPFIALSISCLIAPEVNLLMNQLNPTGSSAKVLKFLGVSMLTFALVFALIRAGKVDRDHDIHHDMEIITEHIEDGTSLSISPSMKADWTTISYFQRFHQINFDLRNDSLKYKLMHKPENPPNGYQSMNLDLQKYDLMIRVE